MLRSLHFTGRLRDLLVLFLPILLMTFSNYLFLFIEKVFLARLSVQAMEAAVSAAYACQIMQIPCVAIASMAQVYVGRWQGAKDWGSIGPGIWQFLWFSCISMLFTVPFSVIFGNYYFYQTPIEGIVWPYFSFLLSINFLFPLGTTLACFYLGLGKTRMVLFATLGSQLIKIFCGYVLIFGWEWIPAVGLMGGAISTLIAQAGYCAVLLCGFLAAKHANMYQSRKWKLQFKLLWECIHPGLLRALTRISMLLSWASISYLMTIRKGDYLLVLSIGGTLFLFLPFLADAICQAQITVISNLLGAKSYSLLNRAFRSACILVAGTLAIAAIPLIMFPSATFHYFFPAITLSEEGIQNIFLGVWICFAFFTFYYIPISYILAFKDTKFLLFMGALNWINGFSLMYVAIEWMHMPAEYFWLVLSLMHGSMALLYYWRMKRLESQVLMPEAA